MPTDFGPGHGGHPAFTKPEKSNSKAREREINFKRITGLIACAECRRLRLRCDRVVPCSTCIRRGCKAVCPTGTMRTGSKENQALLGKLSAISAQPVSIKQALAEFSLTSMSNRICALEEALSIEVAEDHPLLSPELLAIKQGVNMSVFDSNEALMYDMHSKGGTLSITSETGMRFLGASAAEASLLLDVMKDEPRDPSPDLTFTSIPPELVLASRTFPFAPATLSRPDAMVLLIKHLPSPERAASLVEAYFRSQASYVSPVVADQVESLVSRFYPGNAPIKAVLFSEDDLHELALFFMVIANGLIDDATKRVDCPEAEMYMHLGRAALGLRSVFEHGSLVSVQAIFELVSYYFKRFRLSYHEAAWRIMDLGLTIAMSIGIHLDPKRWKLDSETSNVRRRLFWEINISDKWRAMQSGRPHYFSVASYDCEFPTDDGAIVNDDGIIVESVLRWRHRFCRDVVAPIAESLNAVDQIDYAHALKLDKLLRDFEVHPYALTSYPSPSWGGIPSHFERHLRKARPFMHPVLSVFWKEQAIQYLHRNFFARVMLEPTRQNPFHSLYAPSFLATYRSSVYSLHLCHDAAAKFQGNLHRLNALWTFALPCAVVCGAVACKGTLTGFGDAAFAELEKTIESFELARVAEIPRNGLPLLYRIRDKARESLRASKLSRYYASDSTSAFALSAFCAPPSSAGEHSQPSTEDSVVPDHDTVDDNGRSQMRGGLDVSLSIDKPMEELLILLGASRLHTDRGESNTPKSGSDQEDEARSRRHSQPPSTTSEEPSSNWHSPSDGYTGNPLYSPSALSTPHSASTNGIGEPQAASQDDSAASYSLDLGETFPSIADPMIFEMFSNDDYPRMDASGGMGMETGVMPGASSADNGGGARETMSFWQTFMAEMDAMPAEQSPQK